MSKRYFKEALLASMVLTLIVAAVYALITFGIMGILSFFMWVFNYGC